MFIIVYTDLVVLNEVVIAVDEDAVASPAADEQPFNGAAVGIDRQAVDDAQSAPPASSTPWSNGPVMADMFTGAVIAGSGVVGAMTLMVSRLKTMTLGLVGSGFALESRMAWRKEPVPWS